MAKKAFGVCKDLDDVKEVILIEGTTSVKSVTPLKDLIKKHEHLPFDIQDHVGQNVDYFNQTCLIFCSSGTTGLPKGVEITQSNVMACLQTYQAGIKFLEELHGISVVAFNVAPWFHVLGFMSMLMYACSSEALLVYLPKFEENLFYKTIEVGHQRLI